MAGMEGKGNAGGWIDSLKAIIEANPVSEVDAGVRFCHRRVACQKPKMPQNASVLSIPFRFYKKLKLHSERKTFAFLSPALPSCDMHRHSSCQIVRPTYSAFASKVLFLHHTRVLRSAREKLGKMPSARGFLRLFLFDLFVRVEF